MQLRRDLIVHRDPADGVVELVDTLLERVLPVPAELGEVPEPGAEVAGALASWLSGQLLVESATVDGIREAGWAARARRTVHRPQLGEAAGDWSLAEALPGWVSPGWRVPERWRRLAEQRAAGTRLLRLDGLVTTATARLWRDAVVQAAQERCENPYASGWWAQDTREVAEWREAITGGPLCALLGAACGVVLPAQIQMNAWRLEPGDQMAMHADGTRYVATVSLGLTEGLRASDGGAIAFGWPTAEGLEVQDRWLPHLGDVLLFAVEATLWHAVEAVRVHERVTLTGQYLAQAPGG